MSVALPSSIVFSNTTIGFVEIYTKDIVGAYIDSAHPATVVVSRKTAQSGPSNYFTYAAVDAGSAYRITKQIAAVMSDLTPGPVTLIDQSQPPGITNIYPPVFDIMLDTVTVTATGLYPMAIWRLYFDDAASGYDQSGYFMDMQMVNDSTLQGTYTSAGDLALGPGQVLCYIQDINVGILSNTIFGTNLAGTVVTIP